MPDMLTIGMGGLSQAEYRTELFLWTILGAPLILSNDIRHVDEWALQLLTNPEILAVQADSDCVQGSLSHAIDATEYVVAHTETLCAF